MTANRELQFFIVFSIIVFGTITVPVYAAKIIETTKEVDVKKELLAKTLSDLRSYKELFPDFVKSVELKQDPKYAKFTINAQGTHVVDVKSSIQPDGSFVIEVLSGGIKGTKMITTLSERVSFDGKTPDEATTVKSKLILETDFFTSFALMFVGTSQIQKAIGDGFYNVGEYVKIKYPQETINTTPKLEAAKVLEPTKEAIKPQSTSSQNQQTKPNSQQSTFETNDSKFQTQANSPIFAKTDKFSYSSGEQIIVFGTVPEVQKNIAVTIHITRPDGEIVTISQTDVSQNGKFAETFKADGPLYNVNGIYTVSVKYGILGYQTTFEFKSKLETKTTSDIFVKTDKSSYSDGKTILVSGQVSEMLGVPASLRVIAPNGELITLEQIDIGTDKTYSVKLTAGGNLWIAAGTYTIEVSYGRTSQNTSTAITTFEFGGSSGTKTHSPITAFSAKEYYEDGDTVIILGAIKDYDRTDKTAVTVIILDPLGEIVSIAMVTPDHDTSKYEATFKAAGPLWKLSGEYTAKIKYGSQPAEVTFQFSSSE